ncbi:hypothetical protein FB451DRAFT_1164999 [Mycena latifolia]|nr:hypothetical protein FB451DRAFT_1164999 [Mycena latifolia]
MPRDVEPRTNTTAILSRHLLAPLRRRMIQIPAKCRGAKRPGALLGSDKADYLDSDLVPPPAQEILGVQCCAPCACHSGRWAQCALAYDTIRLTNARGTGRTATLIITRCQAASGSAVPWTILAVHQEHTSHVHLVSSHHAPLNSPVDVREHAQLVVRQQPSWGDDQPACCCETIDEAYVSREALAFVKRNRGVALSRETLEIYWSYVSYGSPSLEICINFNENCNSSAGIDKQSTIRGRCADVNDGELAIYVLRSIADSVEGADGVVAANAPHYLLEELGSPSSSICRGACHLIGILARHEFTAAAPIAINPYNQLMALSRQVLLLFTSHVPTQIYNSDSAMATTSEHDPDIATGALIAIATWPDGAEAIVAPLVIHHAEWLASPDSRRRASACMLLAQLAWHKSTTEAVLHLKLCERLVTLLRLALEVCQQAARGEGSQANPNTKSSSATADALALGRYLSNSQEPVPWVRRKSQALRRAAEDASRINTKRHPKRRGPNDTQTNNISSGRHTAEQETRRGE